MKLSHVKHFETLYYAHTPSFFLLFSSTITQRCTLKRGSKEGIRFVI
jgi:hypothetical protein